MPHDHSDHGPNCGCGAHRAQDAGPRPPVAEKPPSWRPAQRIRTIAIAIIERGEQILCGPVYDDAGQIKGWRPLGGGVEFGETAEQALTREFTEETEQNLKDIERIAVLENHYAHEGEAGHEVVFVFSAKLENEVLYDADQLAFSEENGPELTAKWISVAKARAGRIAVFPDGLAELL